MQRRAALKRQTTRKDPFPSLSPPIFFFKEARADSVCALSGFLAFYFQTVRSPARLPVRFKRLKGGTQLLRCNFRGVFKSEGSGS